MKRQEVRIYGILTVLYI